MVISDYPCFEYENIGAPHITAVLDKDLHTNNDPLSMDSNFLTKITIV